MLDDPMAASPETRLPRYGKHPIIIHFYTL